MNIDLFFKSCEKNTNFKFIILTDDKRNFEHPSNVEIIKLSFENMKKRIQSKFDFKIKLEKPYKLCDFRPAFGYIFDDIFKECEYWGYCDLDMIFGNLRKYLPARTYDKISYLGPLSLYRNSEDINKAFMLNGYCKFNYKGIFQSNVNFGFDEIGKYGINSILKKHNYTIYEYQKNVADLNCILEGMNVTSGHSGHYTTDVAERIFRFKDGKIFEYKIMDNRVEKKEYAYLHFQKRKMDYNINNSKDSFIILHHSFEDDLDNINIEIIKNNQPKRKIFYKKWLKYKIKAIKVRVKRIITMYIAK